MRTKIRSLLLEKCSAEAVDEYMNFVYSKEDTTSGEAYTERHHILPKALFPMYASFSACRWNWIRLSGRNHFIAHYLLFKMFPEDGRMALAWHCMCRKTSKQNRVDITDVVELANEYEQARIASAGFLKNREISKPTRQKLSAACKKRFSDPTEGEKLSKTLKSLNRKLTPDHVEKLRKASLGIPKSPEHIEKLKNKQISQEARTNMSKGQKKRYEDLTEREKSRQVNLGRKHTEESRLNMAAGQRERDPLSEETRLKISRANKGRKRTQEAKDKLSAARKKCVGMKWYYKGEQETCALPEQAITLLKTGWLPGRRRKISQ